MDMLLVGWARWSSAQQGPRDPVPAGELLRIATVNEGKYSLQLTDDQFTFVDIRIVRLNPRFGDIIHLEYRGFWNGRRHLLTQEQKWRKLGIGYTAYGDRVFAAQRSLFGCVSDFLSSHLAVWRSRPR